MSTARPVSPDEIRKGFSKAMSDMYRDEVPLSKLQAKFGFTLDNVVKLAKEQVRLNS